VVDASEILKSCTALIEQPAPVRDHYLRRSINSGLSVARDEILGPFKKSSLWVGGVHRWSLAVSV